MRTFFASDLHMGHYNIISLCNRPFNNLDEMHHELITRWNDTVTNEDFVYFLGDFCMNHKYLYFMEKLRFGHMDFILGNHDKERKLNKYLTESGQGQRVTVFNEGYCQVDGHRFFMTHSAADAHDDMPSLVGHSHEKMKKLLPGQEISIHKTINGVRGFVKKRLEQVVVNVGVDVWNFAPVEETVLIDFVLSGQNDTFNRMVEV